MLMDNCPNCGGCFIWMGLFWWCYDCHHIEEDGE